MLRPRIIPCLLVHKGGLVKTKKFAEHKYIGDPINAVRIFNEKRVDELLVLDIDATVNRVPPDFTLIEKLASECRMPLCYGGGISTVDQASRIVDMGVEKVAISAAALNDPSILTEIASSVGRQSVVAVLDVRRKSNSLEDLYEVCSHNGKRNYPTTVLDQAKRFEEAGAGEIIVNSVDRDGMMEGYNLNLAKQVRSALKVPVTFLGGAGSIDDIKRLVSTVGVVGAAAGSLFVFKGKFRAVLISYPTDKQKIEACQLDQDILKTDNQYV